MFRLRWSVRGWRWACFYSWVREERTYRKEGRSILCFVPDLHVAGGSGDEEDRAVVVI